MSDIHVTESEQIDKDGTKTEFVHVDIGPYVPGDKAIIKCRVWHGRKRVVEWTEGRVISIDRTIMVGDKMYRTNIETEQGRTLQYLCGDDGVGFGIYPSWYDLEENINEEPEFLHQIQEAEMIAKMVKAVKEERENSRKNIIRAMTAAAIFKELLTKNVAPDEDPDNEEKRSQ